jgi:uncharacterized repeat protein (TIGR03837 family)
MPDCGFDNRAMRQTGDAAQRWDVFCRVIDNHGDLGVCWRLARRLAALGRRVRLWVDDAGALQWMAPGGEAGVEVLPWREPQAGEAPGEVVVEAFGCDPPAGFVAHMAALPAPPVWINLEYLSAEGYVERSHGLASPQLAGPGRGLTKWFFYPGFTHATGGLLHEPGLERERADFEPEPWLASLGVPPRAGAQRVSLFCYEQPALGAALERWSAAPTQLLVTPGPAAAQVAARLAVAGSPHDQARRGALQVCFLPWLTQPGYDRLLWSCHLNHVRGEDSLVRALWARRPFVWQLYPQHDGAHHAKLEAFLDTYLAGADAATARALRHRFRDWNGLPAGEPGVAPGEPDARAWDAMAAARSAVFEAEAVGRGDLAQRLCDFAARHGARANPAG